MASRLMLSLKKAVREPKGVWSLETMTNTTQGLGEGTLRFAPPAHVEPRRISLAPAMPDEEAVELDPLPQPHLSIGSAL